MTEALERKRSKVRWVGVMRHVEHYDEADPKSEPEPGAAGSDAVVSLAGKTVALQAGRALAEALNDEFLADHPSTTSGEAPRWTVAIAHANTPVTRRTAELVEEGIALYPEAKLSVSLRAKEKLRATVAGSKARIEEDQRTMRGILSKQSDVDVVIAVLHDPAASWLMQRLVNSDSSTPWWLGVSALVSANSTKRWLHSPDQLPLRRGELIMMRVAGGRSKRRKKLPSREEAKPGNDQAGGEEGAQAAETAFDPVWAISPGSDALIGDLSDKIGKKMESAKQLGAFTTALLTFAVTGILERDPTGYFQVVSWSGVGTLAVAVIAYFAALFRYDSLLMPREMWACPTTSGENRFSPLGVFARPPSSAAWILFQNMMLIWLRGFTVACAFVAVGALLVVVGVSEPAWPRGWILVVVLAATIDLAGWRIWRGSRPVLGVND